MTQSAPAKLHVVFNASAATTLRQVLEQGGRRERVIGLADNLSFGPIDGRRPRVRGEWIEEALRCDFVEVVQWAEIFWRNAIAPDAHPVVWLCRDDAAEFCGFLEFLRRRGDAPFKLVDVTGVELVDKQRRKRVPIALGVISCDEMIESGLLDLERDLRPDEQEAYRALGARLRARNAPLRIVAEGSLVSAPIDHYDAALLAWVTNDWANAALIIGNVMADLQEGCRASLSDLWLWGRMRSLAGEGVLQFEVEADDMKSAKVRIAQ